MKESERCSSYRQNLSPLDKRGLRLVQTSYLPGGEFGGKLLFLDQLSRGFIAWCHVAVIRLGLSGFGNHSVYLNCGYCPPRPDQSRVRVDRSSGIRVLRRLRSTVEGVIFQSGDIAVPRFRGCRVVYKKKTERGLIYRRLYGSGASLGGRKQ